MAGTRDWCHFAARVNRSALHRRLKEGQLGYEDEKYSYVAAAATGHLARPASGRIVRHPVFRKGIATPSGATPGRPLATRRTAADTAMWSRLCGYGSAWRARIVRSRVR